MKETGEFLGLYDLPPQNPNGKEEVEVGYLFVRKHWGHGYATEATLACMKYGFEALGLKRIISLIDPNHKKSIAVAERNGLKRESETFYKGRKALIYVLERS